MTPFINYELVLLMVEHQQPLVQLHLLQFCLIICKVFLFFNTFQKTLHRCILKKYGQVLWATCRLLLSFTAALQEEQSGHIAQYNFSRMSVVGIDTFWAQKITQEKSVILTKIFNYTTFSSIMLYPKITILHTIYLRVPQFCLVQVMYAGKNQKAYIRHHTFCLVIF